MSSLYLNSVYYGVSILVGAVFSGILGLPQHVLNLVLPDEGLATAARDLVHDNGLLIHWQGSFTLNSTEQSDYSNLKITCMQYFL